MDFYFLSFQDSVYRPMIPHFHPAITGTVVFFMSGLLHEYILMLIHITSNENINIKYGLQTCFFLFNGGVMIFEYAISEYKIFRLMSSKLPQLIVSLFVIMTVLPIVHWFSEGMVDISLLLHYALGYPMIIVMKD